jgi:AcrR family transcriptional regulator
MARSAARNEQMRADRQERIRSAALELFAAKGLAATKIADIARAAGMSQGLLYHYFRTKEDIYVALVRHAFLGMEEAARGLERLAKPPRDKIALAITELLRLTAADEDFAKYFLLTAQASLSTAIPAEAAALIRKHRAAPYDAIARILRAGQRDGSIRDHDADELSALFWTVIKGVALQRATFGKRFRPPDPALLMHLFCPEERR